MNKQIKLKPCPFCGNKNVSVRNGFVYCLCNTQKIEICWNARPIENVLETENNRLASAFMETETINQNGQLVGSIVALQSTIENLCIENKRLLQIQSRLIDDATKLYFEGYGWITYHGGDNSILVNHITLMKELNVI